MITTLAPILIRLGAPILGTILRTELGGTAGEASAQVIEALGRAFGVEPKPNAIVSAIEADPEAQAKLIAVQNERSAEWLAYLTMATSQRNRMLEREEERPFSRDWRPAMSWMLLVLWSWNSVVLPVFNAFGANIVNIPWEHLLGFSGLWLAIYGGGHTIKSVLGRV
jgi:hypothetical protein